MKPGTPGNQEQVDLEQVSSAYRKLSDEEPPELLDQAVLNRARRAVQTRGSRPWNFGWPHALSTAALAILGVALVVQLPDPEIIEPLKIMKAPSTRLHDAESKFEPVRLPAQQAMKGANVPTMVRDLSKPAAAGVSRERAAEQRADQAPRLQALSASSQTETSAAPATARAEEMFAAPVVIEANDGVTDEAEDGALGDAESPEQWIERIEALLENGRDAEARMELEAFKKAWPDHPLPETFED